MTDLEPDPEIRQPAEAHRAKRSRNPTSGNMLSHQLQRNSRPVVRAGKVMCTVFWDCHGPILVDYLPPRQTINSMHYANLLHKLRDAVKEKRRGKLRSVPLLLHDNAPVHTARVAKEALTACGFEELPHPPYSPDPAPSDFYLFPKMKSELKRRHFGDDDDVKEAVDEYLECQDKAFYENGIRMLKARYQKCIEVKGDYVEK